MMSMINSKSNNSQHYNRFIGLFHHEKPSYVDMKYSYQYMLRFPRLPITLPPFVPTLLTSRWNDEDDCEPLSKKSSHNHYHHYRRRIPKRYSDIISPSSTKMNLLRKDSTNYLYHRSSTNILRRHSLKPINETIYYFNSSKKKSHNIIKHNDLLAHRMQAAMSSELMCSLDRNCTLNERKQLLNHLFVSRSHSFNVCTTWNKKSEENSSFHQYQHFIPYNKINFKNKMILREEPTPDYDESNDEIIIRTIENNNDMNEEPIIDYNDSKSELDEKSNIHSDRGEISSSFIVPQILSDNNEEQIPIPPPLLDFNIEQKKITVRCRTIAENLSSDHKLILKDEPIINQIDPSKSLYLHVSKDIIFENTSQSLSHSHSIHNSISHINDHENELSSSSPTTSILIDNDSEHRSSSSKIYHDYKKRTSLTTTIRNHSMIIHPMHTRIGLRSSTTSSSSANEKLTDMTLSSKQMNVCVINQLNEHLSTRFRKQQQQQQELSINTKNNTDQPSYDSPPEFMSENNHNQNNVYDEPHDVPETDAIPSSSIPPPPPPLPVGGFPPINSSINRLSNFQRTSIMTLTREANNSDILPCSTGTSTISSNLSDTRILRELRENPLFTRAKQHLELEPGSNGRRSGRRLNGSTSNLSHVNDTINETVSYLRLDNCTKTSKESSIPKQLETIIMFPNELDAIIGKRTKSTNDIHQVKSRPFIKSSSQTQCRQSELELIFQKRAQRSEQNLP